MPRFISKKRGGTGSSAVESQSASASTSTYQDIPIPVRRAIAKHIENYGSVKDTLSLSATSKAFHQEFPTIPSSNEYKMKVEEFLNECKAVYEKSSIDYRLMNSLINPGTQKIEIILNLRDKTQNKSDIYPGKIKFIITSYNTDGRMNIKNIEIKYVVQVSGMDYESETQANITFKDSKIQSILIPEENTLMNDGYKEDNNFMFVIGYLLSNNFKSIIGSNNTFKNSLNPTLKESLKQALYEAFVNISKIDRNSIIVDKTMVHPKFLLVVKNYLANAKNHMNAKLKNFEKSTNAITYRIEPFSNPNITNKKFIVDIPLGENSHYFIQIVFTEKEEENQYYSLSVGKINKDASVGKQFLTILFPRSIINPFKISFAGTETLDINSPNDINNNEKYRTDKLLFLNNLFEYFGLLRFSKTLFEKAIYNNPKDEHRFAMQRMKVQITNDVNHILTVFSKNDPTEFAEKLSLSNPENEFNTFMTDKNQYQKLLSPTQMDEKDYWGYVNVEGEAKGGRPRTSAKYNYKKIDKKVKLADGRERSVYVGAKNKQYVKLKGAYVALSGLKRKD